MYKATPTRIDEYGDTEKQCGKCGEWLPMTTEFFDRNPYNGHIKSPCKACIAEWRMTQPCNVDGCPTPRWNTGTSYCRDHHYQIRLKRPPKYTWKPKGDRL